MKIFIGMQNVASLMDDYSAGFRTLGHEVFCVDTIDSTIRSNLSDMHIPTLVREKIKRQKKSSPTSNIQIQKFFLDLAWHKALESDICFFIWESFNHDCSDIVRLKQLGKKIVVRYCGSEVRDPEVDRQAAQWGNYPYAEYNLAYDTESLRRKLHYLRMMERHADLTLGIPHMSLRPGLWREMLLFDSTGIPLSKDQREHNPILLHAPSNRSTKGTEVWQQAFAALKAAGYKFGVKLVEGIPHDQMLREYATADIFCNSLFYGGRASWEAMAAGCVVADRSTTHFAHNAERAIDWELRGLGVPQDDSHRVWLRNLRNIYYYMTPPTASMTVENVAQKLAELILNYPKRQRLASAGLHYVKEVLSPTEACRNILEALDRPDDLEIRARQVWNPFFNHHYSPVQEPQERLPIMNAYTNMVRHCEWYKRYVHPCTRGNLRF